MLRGHDGATFRKHTVTSSVKSPGTLGGGSAANTSFSSTGGSLKLFESTFLNKAWLAGTSEGRSKKSDDYSSLAHSQWSKLRGDSKLTMQKAWALLQYSMEIIADFTGLHPLIPLSFVLLTGGIIFTVAFMKTATEMASLLNMKANVRYMSTYRSIDDGSESDFIRSTAYEMIQRYRNSHDIPTEKKIPDDSDEQSIKSKVESDQIKTDKSNGEEKTDKDIKQEAIPEDAESVVIFEQFLNDNLERTCLKYIRQSVEDQGMDQVYASEMIENNMKDGGIDDNQLPDTVDPNVLINDDSEVSFFMQSGGGFLRDMSAVEAFHFNVEKLVSHLSKGGTFVHYRDMKITRDGGIVDPNETHESSQTLSDVKSCPLLEVFFQFGVKNAGRLVSSIADSGLDSSMAEESVDQFDEHYNWKEIDEGIQWLTTLISEGGKCASLGKTFATEERKHWFYRQALSTMLMIAKDTSLRNKWTHYMVDHKGNVHSVENVSKYPQFVWCVQLEKAYNSEHIWKENWMVELTEQTLRKLIDDEKILDQKTVDSEGTSGKTRRKNGVKRLSKVKDEANTERIKKKLQKLKKNQSGKKGSRQSK